MIIHMTSHLCMDCSDVSYKIFVKHENKQLLFFCVCVDNKASCFPSSFYWCIPLHVATSGLSSCSTCLSLQKVNISTFVWTARFDHW